jgi:hypothetical protein
MSIQSRVTEVFGVDIHPAADIKGEKPLFIVDLSILMVLLLYHFRRIYD